MEEPAIKKESRKKHKDKVNRMRKGIAIENHDDSHEMAVVKKEDIKVKTIFQMNLWSDGSLPNWLIFCN